VTRHDELTHDQAIELLPWLVNGSLRGDEAVPVRAHSHDCVICRRELAQLEALQGAIAAETRQPAPPADMRAINARIDALLDRQSRAPAMLAAVGDWFSNPWRAAFAVQSVLLAIVLIFWLQPPVPDAEFRTLSEPAVLPEGRYVRVVFDPELGEPEISRLIGDKRLVVIAGPTRSGVYTLRDGDGPAADIGRVATDLRAQPGVLFAEVVEGVPER